MQAVEVRAAVRVRADDLRIDYGRYLDPLRFFDNERIPLRPIGPVHCVEPHPSAPDVDRLTSCAPTARRRADAGRRSDAGMDEAWRHAPERPLELTRTPQHTAARRKRLRHKKGGPERPPGKEERLRAEDYHPARYQSVTVITKEAD